MLCTLRCLFALAIGIGGLLASPSAHAQYQFRPVAALTPRNLYFGFTSINDAGQIAYVDGNISGSHLYLYDGNGIATIADNASITARGLNNSGMVAFPGFVNGQFGVYAKQGRVVTQLARVPQDIPLDFGDLSVSISNSGVAIVTTVDFNTGASVLYSIKNSVITTLANSVDTRYTFPGDATINGNGDISFSAQDSVTGKFGYFLKKGDVTTFQYDFALTDDFSRYLFNGGAINNRDEYAFTLFDNNASVQILRGSHGSLIPVADASSGFDYLASLSMNDSGVISYLARTTGENNPALYTGDGMTTHRVLGPGDLLFGKIVDDVYGGQINNSGELAIRATFTDGSNLLLSATAVPEPGSTALLFGLSVTGAGFLMRRRRG